MLHLETVEPRTLSLLKRLFSLPQMKDFHLVGGTALALRYGHRTSIDLDLFCEEKFNHGRIIEALIREFGSDFRYEGDNSPIGIFCFIENIKVDLIYYPHPIIKNGEDEENLRLYSSEDIAAMKMNAILGRGKKKDFWDMNELFHHFSVEEIIGFYYRKFPNQMLLISMPQALTYFTDAEESETPVSLKGQTWESVKEHIQEKVREYLK